MKRLLIILPLAVLLCGVLLGELGLGGPIEPELWEQFRAAWRQNGEQIPPLPEEPRGFWFYRDRFQEQYGKKCEFNPVLQNCTFALMDTEQGRLYVLETDF